ncbi:hypothetical protein [Microbulbifer sp.]|uniref:hypothetical protein n=1 Tax=Microbulbifer sp. TaxID=1908541 RepID=UPI003F663892
MMNADKPAGLPVCTAEGCPEGVKHRDVLHECGMRNARTGFLPNEKSIGRDQASVTSASLIAAMGGWPPRRSYRGKIQFRIPFRIPH